MIDIDKVMPAIWVFGWAIIIYLFQREKAKGERRILDLVHEERMAAIEKGVPYPELPPYEKEEPKLHAKPVPRRILGLSLICILTGFGIVAGVIIHPDFHNNWSFGLIPIFMGIGGVLHYFLIRKQ